MNSRFEPGGDKYEAMKEDDRRAFFEQVQAEREDIIAVLKSVVSTWTENEIIDGNFDERSFQRFMEEHIEWDHDELYATIGEEMNRVSTILSRTG